MAAYQFVVELIPKEWCKKNKGGIHQLYDGEFYDISVSWKNHKPIVNRNYSLPIF